MIIDIEGWMGNALPGNDGAGVGLDSKRGEKRRLVHVVYFLCEAAIAAGLFR
jgi:hypothetical protein